MPQASDELCQLMKVKFGSIDESGPMGQLLTNGYILTQEWLWQPPEGVRTYRDMTRDDFECLMFLVHEWDFGGLVGDPQS